MAANIVHFLQIPPISSQSKLLHSNRFIKLTTSSTNLAKPKNGASRWSAITCSSSNGREPDSLGDGVKKVVRLAEEKRRAELSARIASGKFTVDKPGYARINLVFDEKIESNFSILISLYQKIEMES